MFKDLFLNNITSEPYTKEDIDILRLIRSENVGPRTFWNLIDLFGTATIAIENIQEFSLRGGKAKPVKVFSESDAKKEIGLLEKDNAKFITYKSEYYSRLLLEIYDAPPLLTYKGDVSLLANNRTVAIVGARNASANGMAFAAKIAKELIDHEYITVSGLARGIDAAVHHADISKTIAVIAGGIDHIYPLENAKLYQKIEQNGLIIAELPIGSKPLGHHFPQRNRLISGLSLATIVVEASLKSGSLITARFALEQNRELFSVPGFPWDPRSMGVNKLIKDGAHILQSVDDILENLPQFSNIVKKSDHIVKDTDEITPFKALGVKYSNLLTDNIRKQIKDLLSASEISIDSLQQESELPIQVIYMAILELELAGKIVRTPGNKISLVY